MSSKTSTPSESFGTASPQKALGDIYFHKDLANHFVRPDHVYMLGMRSDPNNLVYTSFVRNSDVLVEFDQAELELLRSERFYTPFDDLTVHGNQRELGRADDHAILRGDDDIRYFENRTQGVDAEAEEIVRKLQALLHRAKVRLCIGAGDFVCVYNNFATHAKEVLEVANPETMKTRWIIKSVNVDRLEDHVEHMVAGSRVLVNG